MHFSQLWVSLRPQQWVKNLFLFAALVFSGKLFSAPDAERAVMGFFIFCIAASAAYLFNDLIDAPQDRLDPEKSRRPIAAGLISPNIGISLSIFLAAVALVGGFALGREFGAVVTVYLVVNIMYTLWLKAIVILDVMIVASLYVLRVIAGAVVISVPISTWLLICTMLLALFLGFSRRRYELIALQNNAPQHRAVLQKYSPYFLDQMISVVTASTVIAYTFYTVAPETTSKFGTANLIYTVPFVLYGIFRYLYLVHREDKGGNPTRVLLTDVPLLINVVLWLGVAVLIIYFRR
ncbi:MAG: decaprenyl-phosphate phosphoribosyltransferase [Bacteroidota bacterium]